MIKFQIRMSLWSMKKREKSMLLVLIWEWFYSGGLKLYIQMFLKIWIINKLTVILILTGCSDILHAYQTKPFLINVNYWCVTYLNTMLPEKEKRKQHKKNLKKKKTFFYFCVSIERQQSWLILGQRKQLLSKWECLFEDIQITIC